MRGLHDCHAWLAARLHLQQRFHYDTKRKSKGGVGYFRTWKRLNVLVRGIRVPGLVNIHGGWISVGSVFMD